MVKFRARGGGGGSTGDSDTGGDSGTDEATATDPPRPSDTPVRQDDVEAGGDTTDPSDTTTDPTTDADTDGDGSETDGATATDPPRSDDVPVRQDDVDAGGTTDPPDYEPPGVEAPPGSDYTEADTGTPDYEPPGVEAAPGSQYSDADADGDRGQVTTTPLDTTPDNGGGDGATPITELEGYQGASSTGVTTETPPFVEESRQGTSQQNTEGIDYTSGGLLGPGAERFVGSLSRGYTDVIESTVDTAVPSGTPGERVIESFGTNFGQAFNPAGYVQSGETVLEAGTAAGDAIAKGKGEQVAKDATTYAQRAATQFIQDFQQNPATTTAGIAGGRSRRICSWKRGRPCPAWIRCAERRHPVTREDRGRSAALAARPGHPEGRRESENHVPGFQPSRDG